VRWRGEARWEEIQQAIVWRERPGVETREKQLRIIHQHLHTHTDIHNTSQAFFIGHLIMMGKGCHTFEERMQVDVT